MKDKTVGAVTKAQLEEKIKSFTVIKMNIHPFNIYDYGNGRRFLIGR